MQIAEFLTLLEEKSGMSPLAFSEEGVISFTFNSDFTANIEKSDDDQLLTVYAKIGDLPSKNREECMKALLEANLFGQKTRGAAIGLDSDTQELYIFKSFDCTSIEFESFFEQFSNILQAQQEWTAIIKDNNFLPAPKGMQPNIYR